MANKTTKLVWVFLAAAALIASGPLQAAEPQKTKKRSSTETQEPARSSGQTTANLNAIAGTAAKSGVGKCLGRINQVTNFVTANSQSAAYLFVSPAQPDKSLVSANLEVQASNALTFASTSFAPTGSDGCGGMYEAVTYWGENCDIVAAKGFPQLKKAGVVQRHVQILQGAGTMRLFLMPAGQGCISIKKEIIY